MSFQKNIQNISFLNRKNRFLFRRNFKIFTSIFRKISKEEFVGGPSATERRKSGVGLDTDAKAELAFNVFDKNHDGYVTKNEMLKVSKNLTKEQVMLLKFSCWFKNSV